MSITGFSVIIFLIMLTATAIEVYRGIRRGFFPTLVSLGLLIPCILMALLIAPGISKALVSTIMNNIVYPNAYFRSSLELFPSLQVLAPAAAQLIVALLMFVVCFALLRPLFRFLYYCFTADRIPTSDWDPGFHREKNSFCHQHNKLLGGIAGGICGLIVCMVITCPFIGALRVADEVIETAESFEPALWSMTTLTEEDVETIKDLPEDLPGNLLYEFGGKYMFYAAAKTRFDGETVYLHTELEQLRSLISHLPDATAVLSDPTSATAEQIQHLKDLRDDFNDLQVCHSLVADYFAPCAQAWLDGYLYFGIPYPQVHPVVRPLMDEILAVCATTDHSTVKANATTLLNICILLAESDLKSQPEHDLSAVFSYMDKLNLLSKVQKELDKNPYMEHIRLSSVSMQLWREIMNSSYLASSALHTFYNNIADTLNTIHYRGYGSAEEKITVFTTYLNRYLTALKLDLPAMLKDSIATELIYLTPVDGTFTGEQIQEFFNQYN